MFWVFVDVHRLSLVVLREGYSSLKCSGFSSRGLFLLFSMSSRLMGPRGHWLWGLPSGTTHETDLPEVTGSGACPRGPHTRPTSPWSLALGPVLRVYTRDRLPRGHWLWGLPSGTTHETDFPVVTGSGACPRGPHTRPTSPWSLALGPALRVDTLD